jgi:hypothetical protein
MRLGEIGKRAALTFSLALLCLATSALGQDDLAPPPSQPPVWASSALHKMKADSAVKTQAAQIKSSFLYRDEATEEVNWFQKAIDGFANWISSLFDHRSDQPTRQTEAPSILGPWVIVFMWGLLAIVATTFLVIAARMFRWRISLKRKARTLLEEDEPERTLDEWLERADLLESQGHYREAVRCLYLACLLKFDEAGVARFDRGQTNWEHLYRIESSPLRPAGLDFREPTRAFDSIWYGMRVNGEIDVARFRNWYLEVSSGVMRKAA